MKAKDLKVATSLMIQGFLRANGAEGQTPEATSAHEAHELAIAIQAIRQECTDWADNLEGANGILASQGAL